MATKRWAWLTVRGIQVAGLDQTAFPKVGFDLLPRFGVVATLESFAELHVEDAVAVLLALPVLDHVMGPLVELSLQKYTRPPAGERKGTSTTSMEAYVTRLSSS